MEEEEEEDETVELPSASASKENLPPPNTPITPITPSLAITKATPAKPRPSNLNLRPLSLTPDTISSVVPCLPSPSPTPSPRGGLRSLSLTPASSVDDILNSGSKKQSRRTSLIISPTPSNQASRKPILNLALDQIERSKSLDEERKPSKRSSISYKRSSQNSVTMMNMAGLPTPEMTPTFGRRYSKDSISNSTDDEVFAGHPTQTRPLSASEQHFLFKSHNALLARITDLERALSMRRRESGGYSNGSSSRPASVASSFSSSSDMLNSASSEPSDEMLRLIADLKSERDELKRDVDGWRTRVSDMENQMNVLTKRVENERRDAWVARSRVGLLEVEKDVLKKKMEELDNLFAAHEEEKNSWDREMTKLKTENADSKARIVELESQLEQVKKELENERQKKVKEENDPLATPTPRSFETFGRPLTLNKKHGLGFASVDSESSLTDVEAESSDDIHRPFGFPLKSVEEENDDDVYSEEEDNGLAGYEDEDEADTDMSLQSSSSFDSEEDLPRSVSHLHNSVLPTSPTTPRPQVFTPPRTSHQRRATLSKTWTFPFGGQLQTPPKEEEDQHVDKFFGCLEDDSDTTGAVPSSPSQYSYEKSKNIFSSGFKFAINDDASFFLPDGVGIPISEDEPEPEEKRLSVVAEDEEEEEEEETQSEIDDDENMFGEAGGICITFTPPDEEEEVEEVKQIQVCSPVKRTSEPPILPALNFGEDDGEEEEEEDLSRAIPFNFGRPLKVESESSPAPAPPVMIVVTPPSSTGRPTSPSMIPRPASPSGIPRPVNVKTSVAEPDVSPTPATDFKAAPIRVIGNTTNSNSFVTPPNKRGGVTPSFIPQPVASPSPIRTMPSAVTKPKVITTSTFIRQPSRKPLLPANSGKGGSSNGSPLIPQSPAIRRSY